MNMLCFLQTKIKIAAVSVQLRVAVNVKIYGWTRDTRRRANNDACDFAVAAESDSTTTDCSVCRRLWPSSIARVVQAAANEGAPDHDTNGASSNWIGVGQ